MSSTAPTAQPRPHGLIPSPARLLAVLGIALGVIGCTRGGTGGAAIDDEAAHLVQRTAEANSALARGDIDRYLALIGHAQDYTLMAPFGGPPTRGFDTSSAHRAAMARLFKSGTFEQDVVATYKSGDLVVLVTIEHLRAEVGGLPQQDWSLRVTQVFRREGTDWRLVHRHADPLAGGISLQQAAALARGDRR